MEQTGSSAVAMLNIMVKYTLSLSHAGEAVSDGEGLGRNVQKERQARVKKLRKEGVGKVECSKEMTDVARLK